MRYHDPKAPSKLPRLYTLSSKVKHVEKAYEEDMAHIRKVRTQEFLKENQGALRIKVE